jgi:hypothetical protein
MTISLIPSAAFINLELASEFGLLPPAFLPVGNKRLYKLQYELISNVSSKIFLSLPEGFEVPSIDREEITNLGIELIEVPQGLSLGESLVYSLNTIGKLDRDLRILYGDTLVYDVDLERSDCFTTATKNNQYYRWGFCRKENQNYRFFEEYLSTTKTNDLILSGYFCFSQPYILIKAITQAKGNFIEGLNIYAKQHHLSPIGQGYWLDCGHVHTYYKTRNYISTQRSFNQLNIGQRKTIQKSSDSNSAKIFFEGNWYQNIPSELRIYTPTFVHHRSHNEYEIEYLYFPTLSDVFVFGNNSVYVWQKIFLAISDFLNVCAHYKKPEIENLDFNILYLPKTLERLQKFAEIRGVDLDKPWTINDVQTPSLLKIAETVASYISPINERDLCVMHGDLCFSNVLYNFRAETIKVIDPRGFIKPDRVSIYGDPRYDIAKLYHSVVGRYDFIIAGYYELSKTSEYDINFCLPNSPNIQVIEQEFTNMQFSDYRANSREIVAICVLLFLSMLPLHSDAPKRQDAFLANALRLFVKMEGEER